MRRAKFRVFEYTRTPLKADKYFAERLHVPEGTEVGSQYVINTHKLSPYYGTLVGMTLNSAQQSEPLVTLWCSDGQMRAVPLRACVYSVNAARELAIAANKAERDQQRLQKTLKSLRKTDTWTAQGGVA